MKIKVCDKCKSKDIIDYLEKQGHEVIIECINYCGIGRSKYVLLIDNKPLIADTKEEIIKKLES